MDNSKITTDDFYLAAYLLTKKFELVDHRRKHRSTFTFEGHGLQIQINQFYEDSVKVSPLKFGKSIKQLKGIMYSIKPKNPQNNNNFRMNHTYQ